MSSQKKVLEQKQKLKEQIAATDKRTALVFFELQRDEAGVAHELIEAVKELGVNVVADESPSKNLEASDVAVVFSKKMLEAARQAGCVPVAQQNGAGTNDYNPLLEKGNGFYFKKDGKWEIFAAIVRALETYKFPYDWEDVVKEVVKK